MYDQRPPRWIEKLCRLLLPARDRDAVSGDLLEEYREAVLPARGRFRANLWYVRQVASLVRGVTWGVVLGLAFGGWILVDTAIDPLGDDTVAAVGGMFGLLVLLLGVPGFMAGRRGARWVDAVMAGLVAGTVTMTLFNLLGIIRVNLFLDVIRQRSDWEAMIQGFKGSGYESLRAYANAVYFRQLLVLPVVGALSGAVTATISYALARVGRFTPPTAGRARAS